MRLDYIECACDITKISRDKKYFSGVIRDFTGLIPLPFYNEQWTFSM